MIVVYEGDDPERYRGLKVFLRRPVKREILERLLEASEEVHMPPSTFQRVSRAVRERFREKIKISGARGRYSKIDVEKIREVLLLKKTGESVRAIARKVGLPKSTVHYIVTRLKRLKTDSYKIILSP